MADEPRAEPDPFYVLDLTDPAAEPPEDEPDVSGTPALFLRRLREMNPVWRSLGVELADTNAGYTREPAPRLWVAVDLTDEAANAVIGCVRVEVDDHGWAGAWVDPSRGDAVALVDAAPRQQVGNSITDPEHYVQDALSWLQAQLDSQVRHYLWWDGDGALAAQVWRREDTETVMFVSGPPEIRQDLSTADEVRTVRS